MSRSNHAVQEEDVDDLDDIVEQFDPRPAAQPQPPEASTSKAPNGTPNLPPSKSKPDPATSKARDEPGAVNNELPDELAKQLAEDMKKLISELSEEGTHGPSSEDEQKRQEVWEKMLIEGMNGMSTDDLLDRNSRSKPAESSSSSQKQPADDFQKSILEAMEKLKQSDSTLHTDASSAAAASDDPLETILKQLGDGLGEAGEDNGDLQDMLETMMQQLMSKEVLYEPLKELHDKFPTYLSENEQKLSTEDKERFNNQMIRVSAIVKIFEDPSYKEEDQEKGAQIVTLMNEMQSFGSPPSEIMGPLPPGFDFGNDGAPKLPEGCTIM